MSKTFFENLTDILITAGKVAKHIKRKRAEAGRSILADQELQARIKLAREDGHPLTA